MHQTSWLALAALFTACVAAFYPDDGESTPTWNYGDLSPLFKGVKGVFDFTSRQAPTLDIKKRRTTWEKRDNKYLGGTASQPTLPNSVPINQYGQDYSYFSSIKFGSKGKDMWMLIDSGSANTWVFGSNCETHACSKHDTFGKENSDTLNITSNEWSVTYGSGDVEGVVASDKVAFAGYIIELGFGLAMNASDDFLAYPMDGILGLGSASSNRLGTPTLMSVMASQKLLKANMFGVHLSRSADGTTDGQITFGAPDASKYSGNLSYTNSISPDGRWEITTDGVGIDGSSVGLNGKTAIIDTGTSYILMPPNDAKALHSKLPGSANRGETFTIPCDTANSIEFMFSGVAYEVSPKDYIGKPDKSGETCQSNIVGHQSFGPDTWLLGDVFLKNVYTVFDFDKDRIGFGTKSSAAISSPSPSSTGPSAPTSAGIVPPPGSSSEPQVTAVSSTESPLSNPTDGWAVGFSRSSLLEIFSVCIATLTALSAF